ncbi:hypothetical protein D9619_001930 [Psilocybe cf. subviscida]|uniref:F-box domain-containing protein n=1 Tax=Psilocybe cf. subviscida TaxID=2480587 RepID=A0A8H5F2S8_9AGAR|nr:hypothetical protein D9619_001930 [Psilocybe cf. subviscida]
MSKRPLSEAQLPPSKRVHVSTHVTRQLHQPLTFDNSLYDELILCIFSHLDWIDLCVTQNTTRNWARLAADNELWKGQYMRVYGRTRLRGAKGFIGRLDGREVRPLPGRAIPDQFQFKDWKWMFRISSNWRKGRCAVEEGTTHPNRHTVHDLVPAFEIVEKTHLLLAGPLTISATSLPTDRPVIVVDGGASRNQDILVPHNASSSVVSITALALDQSPPRSGNLAVACFLSTGSFSVFEFNHTTPLSAVQTCCYQGSRPLSTGQGIIHAVFYHPLLATLSENFLLSIYDLSSGVPQLTQTLSSFTSYPPASLVLSCQSPDVFKLVISYTTPVYPNHWSVGATELIISKSPRGSSSYHLTSGSRNSLSFREDMTGHAAFTGMSVTSSRTIRAFDVPPGWVDGASIDAIREQWSRKLLGVADVQTDGKWVIIAPEDNSYARGPRPARSSTSSVTPSQSVSSGLHSPTSLQLYRLVLPSQTNSISASPPKLNFVRMLHGQTSPISSLALADGRCVSLGRNGSIWVWDLEGGIGAEVATADDIQMDHFAPLTQGIVSFDERRIVTTRAGKVIVRRFDI